jgi:hypothetical protein
VLRTQHRPSRSRAIAQSTADAAALAGASTFLDDRLDERKARDRALEVVRTNDANQPKTRLRAADVQVDLREGHITVEVEARLHGLPRAWAVLLGIEESVVLASATAEAQRPRCVDAGQTAEGFPLMRCEGILKALHLLGEPYAWEHPAGRPARR